MGFGVPEIQLLGIQYPLSGAGMGGVLSAGSEDA